MYITIKCLYLKSDIDPKVLEQYGFVTLNGGASYWLELDVNEFEFIAWYAETRRFVFKYPKRTNARYVKKVVRKYLKEFSDLLETTCVRPTVEWLNILGSWHDYSDEKKERIEQKCAEKQAKIDKRINSN